MENLHTFENEGEIITSESQLPRASEENSSEGQRNFNDNRSDDERHSQYNNSISKEECYSCLADMYECCEECEDWDESDDDYEEYDEYQYEENDDYSEYEEENEGLDPLCCICISWKIVCCASRVFCD